MGRADRHRRLPRLPQGRDAAETRLHSGHPTSHESGAAALNLSVLAGGWTGAGTVVVLDNPSIRRERRARGLGDGLRPGSEKPGLRAGPPPRRHYEGVLVDDETIPHGTARDR